MASAKPTARSTAACRRNLTSWNWAESTRPPGTWPSTHTASSMSSDILRTSHLCQAIRWISTRDGFHRGQRLVRAGGPLVAERQRGVSVRLDRPEHHSGGTITARSARTDYAALGVRWAEHRSQFQRGTHRQRRLASGGGLRMGPRPESIASAPIADLWPDLPRYSEVLVETQHLTAGFDWSPRPALTWYGRYHYLDYDDESAGSSAARRTSGSRASLGSVEMAARRPAPVSSVPRVCQIRGIASRGIDPFGTIACPTRDQSDAGPAQSVTTRST